MYDLFVEILYSTGRYTTDLDKLIRHNKASFAYLSVSSNCSKAHVGSGHDREPNKVFVRGRRRLGNVIVDLVNQSRELPRMPIGDLLVSRR